MLPASVRRVLDDPARYLRAPRELVEQLRERSSRVRVEVGGARFTRYLKPLTPVGPIGYAYGAAGVVGEEYGAVVLGDIEANDVVDATVTFVLDRGDVEAASTALQLVLRAPVATLEADFAELRVSLPVRLPARRSPLAPYASLVASHGSVTIASGRVALVVSTRAWFEGRRDEASVDLVAVTLDDGEFRVSNRREDILYAIEELERVFSGAKPRVAMLPWQRSIAASVYAFPAPARGVDVNRVHTAEAVRAAYEVYGGDARRIADEPSVIAGAVAAVDVTDEAVEAYKAVSDIASGRVAKGARLYHGTALVVGSSAQVFARYLEAIAEAYNEVAESVRSETVDAPHLPTLDALVALRERRAEVARATAVYLASSVKKRQSISEDDVVEMVERSTGLHGVAMEAWLVDWVKNIGVIVKNNVFEVLGAALAAKRLHETLR